MPVFESFFYVFLHYFILNKSASEIVRPIILRCYIFFDNICYISDKDT